MNRIYLGSVGDYGQMFKYAIGEIDNVRLYAPAPVTETPTIAISSSTTSPPLYTPHPTTRKPTTVPTTSPTPHTKILPVNNRCLCSTRDHRCSRRDTEYAKEQVIPKTFF